MANEVITFGRYKKNPQIARKLRFLLDTAAMFLAYDPPSGRSGDASVDNAIRNAFDLAEDMWAEAVKRYDGSE